MSHTQYTETEQETEAGVLTEQLLPVIEHEEKEERIPPLASRPFYAFFKRGFDIVVSSIVLIVLLLPMLIIGLLVVLTSRGPAIYVSTRIGKNGKPFRFYKFRSMYRDAESRLNEVLDKNEIPGGVTFKMKNDPRITRFGKFLRKTSLDELPQLWNVLKGDMSLVGPRPCTEREYALYS
ncbi:MAG: sugar transferase, partial [Eubacteriales bacterium]